MTTSFWQKASYLFGLMAIGLLFGLVVFSANVEIKDLDLWLHLKTGEYIVQHAYVPAVDIFSCRIAGKPWVNHEWLFQVIAYLNYYRWGAEGLIAMQVFVVTATLLMLLLLGYNKEKQFGVIFILLLVMLVYRSRFTIRPDLFSLLFFAAYIYILALHIDKRWSLYALFFVQVLWANFHGFFFFGPFIVLAGIGAEWLKRHARLPWQWNQAGRLTDSEYGQLKLIFLFTILASLINPLTFKGAWYPMGVLLQLPGESRVFFKYIQELQPPIHLNTIFSTAHYVHYKLLILISFLGFVFNRRKIDIGDFFLWLIFLLFSLVAIRNLVFFAFVAYLVCMTNMTGISFNDIVPLRFSDKKFAYITACLLKIMLILWMLSYGTAMAQRGYFDFDTYEMKSEFGGIAQRNYPDKAADFLIANNIKGNFFNDFNSGAYLIGRCAPDIKVFMDGRTEVYGPQLFEEYRQVWAEGNAELFSDLQKRYGLTGALLNSVHQPIPGKTLQLFHEDTQWVLVYLDYDAAIFLKDVPENKDAITRLRIDMKQWKPFALDLQRLGARAVTPYRNTNRAYTLEAMGYDAAALAEVDEALKLSPGFIEPYKIMGKIYGKQEEYQKAFENFRIATMINPGDSEVRFNLALAYQKLNDNANAIKQYRIIMRRDPKNPRSYFMLAKMLIKERQYGEAMPMIAQGHTLDSRAVVDLLKLGELLYEDEEFEHAVAVFEMALATGKKEAVVHHKLGLCYQSMGLLQKAQDAFEKGLAVDPNSTDLQTALQSLGA